MSEPFRHSSSPVVLSVVVGASTGLGRALASELAKAGHRLLLAARDERDLRSVAADCRERYNASVEIVPLDLGNRQSVDAFLGECRSHCATGTNLLMVAGATSAADAGFASTEETAAIHTVNFLQPAHIIAEFLRCRQQLGLATVVVISSIAAAAPRSRNPAYAAAKAALESFCLSLRVELARIGTVASRLQIYRLGYVDTGLSYGQNLLLPAISPERAARRIVGNLQTDFTSAYRYLPGYWRWLALLLKSLPWRLYRRLNF